MSAPETFQIELNGGTVRGTLQRPSAESPTAAVLICRGVRPLDEDGHTLLDEVAAALGERGLAVVRFEHRCADLILDDFDAHTAGHDIEDAMAVHRWLASWTDIDPDRIGVIGYSLGAIAATAIASGSKHLSSVCLLNAPTASYLSDRITKNGGLPELLGNGELPNGFVQSLASIDSTCEATSHDRSTLIIHGAADRFIELSASLEYVTALQAAGRRFERILIAQGDHSFSLPDVRACAVECISEFFASLAARPVPALAKSGA